MGGRGNDLKINHFQEEYLPRAPVRAEDSLVLRVQIHILIMIVDSGQGQVLGLVGMWRDINEAEERLRNNYRSDCHSAETPSLVFSLSQFSQGPQANLGGGFSDSWRGGHLVI